MLILMSLQVKAVRLAATDIESVSYQDKTEKDSWEKRHWSPGHEVSEIYGKSINACWACFWQPIITQYSTLKTTFV